MKSGSKKNEFISNFYFLFFHKQKKIFKNRRHIISEKLKRQDNIKNILIIFYTLLYLILFYYLLTLNIILYERNKKLSNLISINIIYTTHILEKRIKSLRNHDSLLKDN